MSRISKWKDEKLKVKVVFRLQFHASHIPQTGWDKLFISLVPADSGKATAKTTKANVRNGTCKWADPIYETTRLLQDPKTKEYDEKLYKLVVAMGSSRSSFLGEANINLADYADASMPCAVALPLHGCDSGAVLHVTVQLLTSKTGFREFEQQRELREKGFRMLTKQNAHDSVQKSSSSTELANDQADLRVRFKSESRELPSLEEDVELNEDHADSVVGIDDSSNTSESIYAEKQDSSSMHELDSLKSTLSGELGGLSLSQSHQPEKKDPSDLQILQQGSSDWAHGWSSDYSLDIDLTTVYEENSRLRESLEVAESSILELKLLVSNVQSQANELGGETEKYSEQLAAEIASGERLAKEVTSLKAECSQLKFDFEQLQHSRSDPQTNEEFIEKEHNCLSLDVQMKWMQGLLVMEDKLREVQNKACLGYSDCDASFLYSDLEALQHTLQDLKQGTTETVSLINLLPTEIARMKEIGAMTVQRTIRFNDGDGGSCLEGFGANNSLPEGMLHCFCRPEQISVEAEPIDITSAMETKIHELQMELEESKTERESLAQKMGQMECYYEALVQGLEESQKQMLVELQNLRNEHSSCLYTISSCKTEVETVHQEMNDQFLKFAEDRHTLESLNKELEKMAITSEAALRRVRLNYSVAVDRLQKDLELLSLQVLSLFETNENLIRQAFAEGSQLCFQEYVGTVDQGNAPLLDEFKLPTQGNHAKLLFQNQNFDPNSQFRGGEFLLEDLKRLLHSQEDRCQMVEAELYEMHVVYMHLDVFAKVLQETLHETYDGTRIMKEKMDEFAQQLEHSTKSKELLMLQLKTALDDVSKLSEYKSSCVTRCSDLALQTQILEDKLESVSSENCLLTQKIAEYEGLIMESRSYKSKYTACTAENTELMNILKQETLEKANLLKDISALREELTVLKVEFDNQVSVRDNLDRTVNFLQDKLGDLVSAMLSYREQLNASAFQGASLRRDLQNNDTINNVLHLGELQKEACEIIIQLTQEKRVMEEERDIAQRSLHGMESEILSINQMFASELNDMVTKLALSNAYVEKLQLQLEGLANGIELSKESEENYAEQNQELFSKGELLEVELQHVVTENRDIAQKILALESVNQELERMKQENQALKTSLAADNEEYIKLALEFDNLKASLGCMTAELNFEKEIRAELEGRVSDITAQLNEKHDQLLGFDQQKAELVNLKQLASNLEEEKSRASSILVHRELCLKEADESVSSLRLQVTKLGTCLAEVYEYLLAADVEFIFTRNEFQTRMQELDQQLDSLGRRHEELSLNHLDVLNTLKRHTAIEGQYAEEKAQLLAALESLKSELEASVSQRNVLLEKDKTRSAEFVKFKTEAECEKLKIEAAIAEAGDDVKNSHRNELEVGELIQMLDTFEEEINKLRSSRDELEITVTVLRAKLDEQCAGISLPEENVDELMMLRNQHNELTQKLSEQILKTEEFKNLSIYLKGLKNQADAECTQAREKKESEALSVTMQESLRIAFIKEQCETKLQELRNQLYISKRHGEEMLLKLQDALDEVENRKKSEASHIKKNKELSLKIVELETELQSVLSDKREKAKAYDGMKAELECSLISLDCCKEDKQKLEASLQECEKEKSRIAVELCSMREQLRSCALHVRTREEGNTQPGIEEGMPNEKFMDVEQEVSLEVDQYLNSLDRDKLLKCKQAEDEYSISSNESSQSSSPITLPSIRDNTISQSALGSPIQAITGEEALLESNVALNSDHFKAQTLKSRMDLLHRELERIKNENLVSSLPQDDHECEPAFPGLQNELVQLHEANEQLGSLFPLFNKFTSGNALERVLALEIELAEALQAKKKTTVHFQSSFLKQHSDEEAVFQSFRDINELIKDMLDLKGRYRTVENELKEMHGRYSDLSLRFAEVEGERQRLLMTLKNVRIPKKFSHLNFSSSASVEDFS